MQQLKSVLMSSYEVLIIVLGLSRDTGLVYMMNVNNWSQRCAHRSPERPRVGLQSLCIYIWSERVKVIPNSNYMKRASEFMLI